MHLSLESAQDVGYRRDSVYFSEELKEPSKAKIVKKDSK